MAPKEAHHAYIPPEGGPDCRVTLPERWPGQTDTIQVTKTEIETTEPKTLATTRTEEGRGRIIAEIRGAARGLRREAAISDDERLSITHRDLLYDDDGLPA